MVSRLALLCSVLAALATAQSVDMHFIADDTGEVWLNGQRVVPPHLTGDTAHDTSTLAVPLRYGDNALAVRVTDGGWTAGFAVSMDLAALGCPDTVRSDTLSFRCMDTEAAGATGAEVSTAGFGASAWITPGDYGPAGYDSLALPPLVDRRYLPAAVWYLRYQRARWLWGPRTIYIRKSFVAGDSVGEVMIRGHGYSFRQYLNGRLVNEWSGESQSNSLYSAPDQPLDFGAQNVVAVEATCVDTIDFAFLKAGVRWRTYYDAQVLSDTSWRYSWSPSPGWNGTGFVDTGWVHAGAKRAYDGVADGLTNATWIWATDMWFRTEFSLQPARVIRSATDLSPARVSTPGTRWYTLAGKRFFRAPAATRAPGVVVNGRPGSRSAAVVVVPVP